MTGAWDFVRSLFAERHADFWFGFLLATGLALLERRIDRVRVRRAVRKEALEEGAEMAMAAVRRAVHEQRGSKTGPHIDFNVVRAEVIRPRVVDTELIDELNRHEK